MVTELESAFTREPAADKAMRHAVAIAVELQAEIFVDQRLDGVAIVVRDDRQRAQGFGAGSDRWGARGFRGAGADWRLRPATAAPGGSHRAGR